MITDKQLYLAADRLLDKYLESMEEVEESGEEYDPEDESIHCGYCACYIGENVAGVSPEGWNLCKGCANEG
jgi:hypothetical protein